MHCLLFVYITLDKIYGCILSPISWPGVILGGWFAIEHLNSSLHISQLHANVQVSLNNLCPLSNIVKPSFTFVYLLILFCQRWYLVGWQLNICWLLYAHIISTFSSWWIWGLQTDLFLVWWCLALGHLWYGLHKF